GTGGGTAGGAGGGTGGGTGGSTADAGRNYAPLQLSALSLPASLNYGSITGLSGHPGELWAVSDNGHVYRRTDGGFGEMLGWTSSWTDVYVAPTGAVFIASNVRTLRWCLNNCTSPAAFDTFDIPNSSSDLDALCGSSATDVYAIANRDSSIAILWHWDGVSWTQLSNNLGLISPRDCYLRPDGVLFITGIRDVVRWEQGAATVETAGLDLSALGADATSQTWTGIHGLGDSMVTVGAKKRALTRNAATSTWSLTANPINTSTNFNAVGFAWPDEAYAASNSGAPKLLHVSDGGPWVPTAVDLPAITSVNEILVLTPDEVYFGGSDNNGPVIVRGRR
ncbi:MAG: hypothetical protein H6Q89_5350, partial [Myxococcaceae bacterium]|nr:hypothetical protein [Myxococcaceae bacterium]